VERNVLRFFNCKISSVGRILRELGEVLGKRVRKGEVVECVTSLRDVNVMLLRKKVNARFQYRDL
jgi:aminoglycoside phosphotransferase family enzyme